MRVNSLFDSSTTGCLSFQYNFTLLVECIIFLNQTFVLNVRSEADRTPDGVKMHLRWPR